MSSTQQIHSLSRQPFMQWVAEASEALITESPLPAGDERLFEVRLRLKKSPQSSDAIINEEYPVEYLISSARLLEQSGEFLLAKTLYSFVLARKDSRNFEALYGTGICNLKMGDTPSALKIFQNLFVVRPSVEVTYYLALCLANDGKDLLAIEKLKKKEILKGCEPALAFEFHKLLANCLIRVGRLSEAEVSLRISLSIKNDSDVVFVNLGMLELQRKNSQAAFSAFFSALSKNGQNVKAIVGIGLSHMMVGELPKGAECFHQALDIEPNNAIAITQLLSLNTTDSSSLVPSRAERFLELDPDNFDVRYRLAAWFFHKKKWSDCERQLSTILKKQPTHAGAQSLLSGFRTNLHQRGGIHGSHLNR